MLSFEQKDLLNCIVYAMAPYEELTDLLSAEQVVTSSSVAPMLHHIKNLCDVEVPALRNIEIHTDIIKEIRKKIWTYVGSKYVKLKKKILITCS